MASEDGSTTPGLPKAYDYLATVHVEENHVYWQAPTPSSGRDYWFWSRIATTGAPVSKDVPLTLPFAAAGPYSATLRVAVKSRGDDAGVDPDHHLRLLFNGSLLDDRRWDGEQVQIVAAVIPQESWAPSANSVRLELPGRHRSCC